MSLFSAFDVNAQVENICRSELFAPNQRSKQLLRYLIKAAQEGTEITEYGMAWDVFERPNGFDPKKDSLVRVSVAKLRRRLLQYYETAGRRDRILIRLPPGTHSPLIANNPARAEAVLDPAAAMHVFNAKAALQMRRRSGHDAAVRYLNLALEEHPDHPLVLSVMAMVHAARAMYGSYPRSEFAKRGGAHPKSQKPEYRLLGVRCR